MDPQCCRLFAGEGGGIIQPSDPPHIQYCVGADRSYLLGLGLESCDVGGGRQCLCKRYSSAFCSSIIGKAGIHTHWQGMAVGVSSS